MGIRKTVRVEYSRAVGRYLRDREAADCSTQTLKWYRQKLAQLDRALSVSFVDEIGKDQLLDFVGDLRDQGRSRAYLRGWHQLLRQFIGWCREEGYAVHPSLVNEQGSKTWFTIRKPPEVDVDRRAFTEEELERILEAAGSPRNRLFIRLLAGTGLRLGEALGLTVQDVEGDRVRVRHGKGRRSRMVPLNHALERDLERYVAHLRPDVESDRLFLSRTGQPWSDSAVFSLFQRIRRSTGLPIHAHALRHHFSVTYMENGGELDRLRRILGHSSFKMSSHYAAKASADLNLQIERLTIPRRPA